MNTGARSCRLKQTSSDARRSRAQRSCARSYLRPSCRVTTYHPGSPASEKCTPRRCRTQTSLVTATMELRAIATTPHTQRNRVRITAKRFYVRSLRLRRSVLFMFIPVRLDLSLSLHVLVLLLFYLTSLSQSRGSALPAHLIAGCKCIIGICGVCTSGANNNDTRSPSCHVSVRKEIL